MSRSCLGENTTEKASGVRVFVAGDLLRRALPYNAPTALAAFRAEVDDPIGFGNEVQVMLDDNHRMAAIHHPLKPLYQPLDVRHVQADGWFFEDEQVPLRQAVEQVRLLQAGQQ